MPQLPGACHVEIGFGFLALYLGGNSDSVHRLASLAPASASLAGVRSDLPALLGSAEARQARCVQELSPTLQPTGLR